jgi:hypothetical protein
MVVTALLKKDTMDWLGGFPGENPGEWWPCAWVWPFGCGFVQNQHSKESTPARHPVSLHARGFPKSNPGSSAFQSAQASGYLCTKALVGRGGAE